MEALKRLDLFKRLDFDDFGPERIICAYDPKTRMKGYLVIDNTARGMGKGGTRMTPDLTLETVFRLARTMTWKWAITDINLGGAKGGIVADPRSPNKEDIVRAYARAFRDQIPDVYVFGLDEGLDEKDAAILVDELDFLGTKFGASAGKPRELGGVPYDKLGVTGYGVAEVTEEICDSLDLDLGTQTVSVQGLGAVGAAVVRYLHKKGARIVAVSRTSGAIYDPNGLDVEKLLEIKERKRKNGTWEEYGMNQYAREYARGAKRMKLGEELTLDVDILIPAATEDVITDKPESTYQRKPESIKAKIVVQGANMPTTPRAEKVLHRRGILQVPDILANAGAAIAAAHELSARFAPIAPNPQHVFKDVSEKLRQNTRMLIEEYTKTKRNPREIMLDIARRRVLKAMELRGRLTNEIEQKYKHLVED